MSTIPSPLGVLVNAAVSSPPASAGASAPAPRTEAPPIWPRSAQVASVAILLIVMGLLSWNVYGRQRWSTRPTTLERDSLAFRVDLNHADRAQLLQLPGVGEALVQRIEDYRSEHYGFRNIDELANISGIGPLTVERLRHLVYVDPAEGDDEREAFLSSRAKPARATKKGGSTPPKSGFVKKEAALTTPVDINQADAEELQRLPGIGPALAGRILEARKSKSFQAVEDLRRVPGIGAKTLGKLRPHVTVGAVRDEVRK